MPNEISGNASASSTAGFDPEYLRAGQRISETFTLRNVIPSSLGDFPVWIAEDEVAGRQVCLHFVPAEVSADPSLRVALKEEVRKTRNLHHDHILRVHELIEGPDWAAVVTNFYEGESLARHLQESPVGAFECSDVKPWLDTLVQTMSDVHSVPVLHRNISPADIIVTPDGSIMLANFGTRRVIVDALRRAGIKEGKYLAYSSPQLLEGEAPSVSDDIYAIGATLFQLLTGKRPFEGVDVEKRIATEKPPGVIELRHKLNRDGQELFKNWERTIAQCLSKDPMERPINIGDLAKRLASEPEAAPKPAPKVAPAAAPESEEAPAPAPAKKAPEPEPQHMGLAADEHDEEPEAPPARERTSPSPRPLLTSYGPEPKSGRSKLALVALLLVAGGVGAWFGASFFMHKADDIEEDEPAPMTASTPKETEHESDIKFVAPNSPDSAPELTALRPGQLPKTKPGSEDGIDGTPTPVSPEPPARAPGVGALASNASVPPAPALPAVDESDATLKKAQEAARTKVDPAKQDAITKREQELARKAQEIERKEQEVAKKEQEALARKEQESARKEQEAMARKEQEELEKIKAQKPVVAAAPDSKTAKGDKVAEKAADKTPAKPTTESASKETKSEASKDVAKEAAKEEAPKAAATAQAENSLGMKFVPVGDVMFSTNKTRVKDYAQFVKETGYPKTHWKNPGFEQTPDHPVVMVSWTDALSFCKWLTDKEQAAGLLKPGESYRLPTDLEWSKAVGLPTEKGQTPEMRDMGIQDHYPWGTSWPPPKGAGNYTGKETGAEVYITGFDDGFPYTAPVGSFAPNAQGLYDMGGNAWEWCMDTWNPKARSRVLRGASWYQGALQLSLLSSCRIHSMPDRESDNYGFRVVRAPAGKTR
jgi:formylglycine-generating enzyme required for sulfatase activity/serine/threonine protein kinase